jgi:hypothetical protein
MTVRDDERPRCHREPAHKMIAFVISASLAAVAGSAFAYFNASYFPNFPFSVVWTFEAILVVFIGGIGTVVGPILGSVFFVIGRDALPGGLDEVPSGDIWGAVHRRSPSVPRRSHRRSTATLGKGFQTEPIPGRQTHDKTRKGTGMRTRLLVVLSALALVLTACGDGEGGDTTQPQDEETTTRRRDCSGTTTTGEPMEAPESSRSVLSLTEHSVVVALRSNDYKYGGRDQRGGCVFVDEYEPRSPGVGCP